MTDLDPATDRSLVALGKQPVPASPDHGRVPDRAPDRSDGTVIDVAEVHLLHERLRLADRELQSAHQQLWSSNEELETVNNELQATVAELETTNEELHSTNETLAVMNQELTDTDGELKAINDELRERTAEVDRMRALLGSVLDSLGPAMVVVDRDLRVNAWNERATELWGIRSDEALGRSLNALDVGLPFDELGPRLARVLTGRVVDAPFEAAVNDRRSHELTCIIRCAPLRRADRGIDGAVVSVDVVA